MSDDLTERREADALRVWKAEGKAPAGICPHCGSTVSVVQRDGWFRARCAHQGCGASGSKMRKLTRAVETFCRPGAYVLRHMGVHRSSLTDTITLLEEERDQARSAVAALVAEVRRLDGRVVAAEAEATWRIENETRAAKERDAARAEVERLRGVIHDALDKWATTGDVDYAMGAMHKEAAGE